MYLTCRHIKSNGLACESPALRGRDFCYYHSKSHTIADDVKFGPVTLPVPEDPAAIQISVARINEAVLRGHLDLRKAQAVLAGLKLAARFIDARERFDTTATVTTVDQDTRGGELAPQNVACDEDDDCDDCPYSKLCDN